MSKDTRHLTTLPDGRLAVTTLNCEDDSPDTAYLCAKTRFELGRKWMQASETTLTTWVEEHPGTEISPLVHWQMNIHYVDFESEVLALVCRPIHKNELPLDRSQRNRWVDTGSQVIIDATKPLNIQK